MKKFFVLSIAICITLFLLNLQSCKKDPCMDVVCQNGWSCVDGICQDPCAGISCQNGGTCIDGSCDCPYGFGGTDCSVVQDIITASIDGNIFQSTSASFQSVLSLSIYSGSNAQNEVLSVSLDSIMGLDTFELRLSYDEGEGNWSDNGNSSQYKSAYGEAIITRYDTRIQGTFWFTGYNSTTMDSVYVTNGYFDFAN